MRRLDPSPRRRPGPLRFGHSLSPGYPAAPASAGATDGFGTELPQPICLAIFALNSENRLFARLLGNMDAALDLFPTTPASRARILTGLDLAGAGGAADRW